MTLSGKKVLVYGTGKSGQGAAALLRETGAEPFFYDDAMGGLPAAVEECDLAVLSPGVPVEAPRVQELRRRGIRVIGEVELAWETGRGRVFAITGTNGKTTTTTLLGEIMKAAAASVFVVGNIGTPYTSAALQTRDDSVIVAEISSFQLETVDTFHPVVTAILNITEDHLNRHHTMAEYSRVKESITANQTKADVCVLNFEDEELRRFGAACPARVIWFSSERELEEGFFLRDGAIWHAENGKEEAVLPTDEIQIIGIHNYENVMAAMAMAYAGGVPMPLICDVVRAFRAVEHRIEYVGKKRGVVWYNDSKGTNPDAAIKGIKAMRWPTFLIGGGYDKGADYKPWIRAFDGKVKAFLLEGKTAENIRRDALDCGFPEEKIVMCGSMTEAMRYAASHAEEGDAVLLSPACASWGEFPNYEVRGREFKAFFESIDG